MRLLESDAFPFGAEGLFETFPIVNGEPVLFDEHWQRLERSARSLGFPFPFKFPEARNFISNLGKNRVIRLTYKLESDSPELFVQLVSFKPVPSGEFWTLFPVAVQPHPLASHKITGRESYESSLKKGVEAGADDSLLIDNSGDVLETTKGNFFAVFGESIRTPPADGRILPGIFRGVLLQNSPLQVEEKKITANKLQAAGEIFVANSVRGIIPVREVIGIWKQKAPASITERLALHFQKKFSFG